MSALTSLLVRDQVVPVRKIEDAIQRQVISGGDIETVLLEMEALPENVMSAYRAALYGLLPATREEVMTVSRETLRAVPKEVATQYRLVPLSAEGKTLVVAVTAPLSIEDDQQLGFLLGQELVYRIVSEVRLAAALSHHYNIDAVPRMRRLAEKLRSRDAGRVPYVAPPEKAKVDTKAADLPSKQSVVDWDDEEEAESAPAEPAPPAGQFVEPADSAVATERPPPMVQEEIDATERGERPSAAPARAARKKIAKKLRGPLTAKAAVELLKEAEGRDEILEIFFVFARQFFDFTALFVVHDDIAEGRDAWGEGAGVSDIRQIAVPLDVPGTFAAVKEGLVPLVTDMSQSELDVIVTGDLGRLDSQPCMVAPVAIKKRVVLMIYGDRSGESFGIANLPELVAFLPRVADAFLALLLRRKRKGYAAPERSSRPDLKSAATRITAGAVASEPLPEKSGYRHSHEPPEPEPTPADGQRDTDVDGPTQIPSQPEETDRVQVGGPSPLGVLGVPRSAPPPPMTQGENTFHLEKKETRPDGHAAIAQARSRQSPIPPRNEPAPEPDIEVEVDDDEEDADSDGRHRRPGGESDLPQFAKSQATRPDGGYHTSGTSEVLGRADAPPRQKRKRKKKPKKKADDGESRERRDPRSEKDATIPAVEVVHVPDVNVPTDEAAEDDHHRGKQPRATPNMPSVIVDMGDTVEVLVDDLEKCGPDGESAAVNALMTLGEAALPTLTQRFPGPLWFDRKRPHRRLPRGRDISAIARAFVAFRSTAVPYVISLLEARDPDVRFYGTLLASEFVSVELLVPVGERIFDRDPGTQLLAVDVLKRFGRFEKEMEELLKAVRVEARVDRKDPERRRVAVRALGLLRDVRAVDILVELVGSAEASLADQAQKSLILLTRQDFGDSQRRWSQWFEKNRSRHRVEWLIDGLVHTDEDIRAAAGDELQLITQEYYGYHPRLPKRDREVAHKRYRKWWEGEGRARFSA